MTRCLCRSYLCALWNLGYTSGYQHTAGKGHQALTSQNQLYSPACIILFHNPVLWPHRGSAVHTSHGNACWLENCSTRRRSFSYSPQQTLPRLSMLSGSSTCPNRKQLTPLCPLNSDSKSVQAFETLVQISCSRHRLWLFFLYRAPCAWTLEAAKAHDEGVMIQSTQWCLRKHVFPDLDCKDHRSPGFFLSCSRNTSKQGPRTRQGRWQELMFQQNTTGTTS